MHVIFALVFASTESGYIGQKALREQARHAALYLPGTGGCMHAQVVDNTCPSIISGTAPHRSFAQKNGRIYREKIPSE